MTTKISSGLMSLLVGIAVCRADSDRRHRRMRAARAPRLTPICHRCISCSCSCGPRFS